MRIALFSDIHANLPAFEAFFADVDSRKPDAIYCLGDLVGYNVWPNEVISEIRKRGIATLAGNHDLKVKGLFTNEQNLIEPGKNHAYHLVTETGRSYLQSLPALIRLEFQVNNNPLNILLVHGSPRSIDEYVLEDIEENIISDILKESGADILCGGHSHKPFHRIIKTGETHYKHVINIGSVGKPKDGDSRGCYVMIKIDENSTLQDPQSIDVNFIRFEYNVEAASRAIEASPLPDEFADRLRKAY